MNKTSLELNAKLLRTFSLTLSYCTCSVWYWALLFPLKLLLCHLWHCILLMLRIFLWWLLLYFHEFLFLCPISSRPMNGLKLHGSTYIWIFFPNKYILHGSAVGWICRWESLDTEGWLWIYTWISDCMRPDAPNPCTWWFLTKLVPLSFH